MENNYLISVIVPVHNTVNYLRKCIESIRNQSLENIEIILVDNLSTDGFLRYVMNMQVWILG